MKSVDVISIASFLSLLTLLPIIFSVTTSYMKFSLVFITLRNAMGVQQAPSTIVINGLAICLTLYVMSPTFSAVYKNYTDHSGKEYDVVVVSKLGDILDPLRQFMIRNSREEYRQSFVQMSRKIWPKEFTGEVTTHDYLVVVPSFMLSEIRAGFEIGFLLYMPFIVVDLVVSNILLALGMQMISPMTISLPMKIMLFGMIDGWAKLAQMLVLGYH